METPLNKEIVSDAEVAAALDRLWHLNSELVNVVRGFIRQKVAALTAAEADAAFYRCCALSGEVPEPGSEPSANCRKGGGK